MRLNFCTIYKKYRGFSLLEVMVTAAIIGIITAIIVINYGSFNNTVLLSNQAFEVALDLREAQVNAVSVRGQSAEFREAYGMYFDVSDPQEYILFQDNGNDEVGVYYDSGEEIGKPYIIDSRFAIVRICVNYTSSDECPYEVDDLVVSFLRPDFDARFASSDADDQGLGAIYNARVEIKNLQGDNTRAVVVDSSGQIKTE